MPKYIQDICFKGNEECDGDNDTFRFITLKFGELTVTARHYMDLLKIADRVYPKYVEHVYKIDTDCSKT